MRDKDNNEFIELEIIKKNDNYLITANTVFLISLSVLYGFSIVVAILLFVSHYIMSGIILLILSTLSVFVIYVFFKLFLSMLFDIKMIRNKLYNLKNDNVYRLYNNDLSNNPQFKNDVGSDEGFDP